MAILGKARRKNLWVGEVHEEMPEGYLVRDGASTTFLHRDLAQVLDSPPWDDNAMWDRWHERYREPNPAPAPERVAVPVEKGKPAPASGWQQVPGYLWLLTIMRNGIIIIDGTEEAGITIEDDGVQQGDAGDGTKTVLDDGVEL